MTAEKLAAAGLRVKPLEWEAVGAEFWAKDGYGDNYEVAMNEAGSWSVNHPRLIVLHFDFNSPDEARAECEADYAARILAALEEVSE